QPRRFRWRANPVNDGASRLGEALLGYPLPLMGSLSHSPIDIKLSRIERQSPCPRIAQRAAKKERASLKCASLRRKESTLLLVRRTNDQYRVFSSEHPDR